MTEPTLFSRQHGKPIGPEELKNYTIVSRIGQGSFSYIYRAENPTLPASSPLRCIAIKRFKTEYVEIGEQEAIIMNSLASKSSLGSENGMQSVVQFFSGFEMENSYVILLELLDMTKQLSLSPPISRPLSTVVSEPDYKVLAKLSVQLLTALVDINNRGYVHCDIKPENILYVDAQYSSKIKLIDFGNATRIADLKDYTDDFELQSPGYRAPEVLMGDATFTEKIDVWSIGVVLLELLVNKIYLSFRNDWRLILNESIGPSVACITKVIEPLDVYKTRSCMYWSPEYESKSLLPEKKVNPTPMIMNITGVMLKSETSKLALDFLLCLLRVDHKVRWTAKQALKHPFLTSTLNGAWSNVLFPEGMLMPGNSQLLELGLI